LSPQSSREPKCSRRTGLLLVAAIQRPAECNHMGIFNHFFLVESPGVVASGDN